MSDSPIDYPAWIQEAFRSVVRRTLDLVAAQGLPEGHHFYISFWTAHPEVEISESLAERYPETMLIVLQNQFWNLVVEDEAFTVELSFGGQRQRLKVPFASIILFEDRGADFSLLFQPGPDEAGEALDEAEAEDDDEGPDDPTGGNVVSLDSFRKR